MIRTSFAIVASLVAAACGGTSSETDTGTPDGALPDASASPFTPPYMLPTSGTVVDIPATNTANDVRPPGHDAGSWQYALFQTYGGGVFQPAYSQAGAYVFAGQGGHEAPPVYGAALFDFTDGTWKYQPNGNGFDENRSTDVSESETNGMPYVELVATTAPEMPAPGHTYSLMIAPPPTATAAKGTVIRVFGTALAGPKVWDSYQSHQLDLATGVWSRAAQNLASDVFTNGALTDQASALDPVTGRIYVSAEWPHSERLSYLDLADRTWKTVGSFTNAPGGDRYARAMWVDAERRLLLIHAVSDEQGVASLWAFDLDNVSSGPHAITVNGELPRGNARWHLYPKSDGGDGAFYTLRGRPAVPYDAPPYPLASEQVLDRLEPPTGDPLTTPWTYSAVPITGGIMGEYVTDFESGARHMTRFFYVPAIRCFAWIPNGTGAVQLIKP